MDKNTKSFTNKSSDYYRHLIENAKDILYLINAKTGEFEYVSSAVTVITGFTPRELARMGAEGIAKRTHPDTRETIWELKDILAKKVHSLVLPSLELKFKHKAGHYVWLGINRNLITDGNGEIDAIVGNVRDITETKLLQERLKSTLDNYKTLYGNARVALYRTRISDGKVLECNEFMAGLLGYGSREECIAKAYTTEYLGSKNREKFIKLLKEKGQLDNLDNFELKARRANGELIWIRVSARVYPDKGYLEGALWDITASKILTQIENKILELIMQGKSSREIALHLKRSVRTIEDHRAGIMRKLKVDNLVELTKKVMNSGIDPEKK